MIHPTILASTESATWRIAEIVADAAHPGDVIALRGDLGAGKTVFARAFVCAACAAPQEVPSPTFTLVQTYETERGEIWHFDLYRLSDADEAIELGIEDAFADAISLIEWPDRLGDMLPEDRLDIWLEHGVADDERHIRLCGQGSWQERLGEMSFD